MTRAELSDLLEKCSRLCVEMARSFVTDDLPEAITFQLLPNQSFDEHPLEGDQQLFPGDSLAGPDDHLALDFEGAVGFLWRDGKVPEWVDLSVVAADAEITTIEMLCCGRFTSDPDSIYYTKRGQGPFGIKSPALPAGWSEGQRFRLFSPRELRRSLQD